MVCTRFLSAVVFSVLWLGLVPGASRRAAAAGGELTLVVVDAQTRQRIACRIHLSNAKGRPQKVAQMPFWHDHFVCPGQVKLKLPRGGYTFVIERGPEYVEQTGHFTIDNFADDEHTVELKRAADMAAEGWWSADLDVHRPLEHVELLMQAEDLHLGQVITWSNRGKARGNARPAPVRKPTRFDGNRYYAMAGQDDRQAGAVSFLNLQRALDVAGAQGEFPSPMSFILEARKQPSAWIDVKRPSSWDLPAWLAAGAVDSIALAHSRFCRDRMEKPEHGRRPAGQASGSPPARPQNADGPWSQEIYYHLLNCGLRISPSAGSGSGIVPNPVGYNRVYAWVDPEAFSYEAWWEAFKAGRVVVTNGPLMRPLANGRHPGHVFKAAAGEKLPLDVMLNFTTRDPISYFELVKDGKVVITVPYEQLAKTGHFPPLEFDESGWFLVRVVADVKETYRFASSGPWYVEIGDAPRRVSRRSAQFFLDWAVERAGQIKLDDADELRQVRAWHEQAATFWRGMVARANAD
ncbi:MAG: hypothetical protein WD278_04650 [Pirellulales bacterium]